MMLKTEMYRILSRSPVFKGLPPIKIEELLGRVQHRFVKHEKGHMIAFRGDQCDALLILVQGSVRGEMVDISGKAVQVETIPAPRPIAPAFVFGENNQFPVDVVAEEPIIVLSIPKSSLITLIQVNSSVLKNFLSIISSRTRFLTGRLWFMSFKTIKEKLAHYIFSLLKPGETKLVLPKNQQELSEYFGVSRPSLARVIKELETDGIIAHRRKEIFIKDLDRLKGIVE